MVNIIVELSKYLIITIIIMYTYLCFRIFGYQDAEKKQRMLKRQNTLMFMLQLIAFMYCIWKWMTLRYWDCILHRWHFFWQQSCCIRTFTREYQDLW